MGSEFWAGRGRYGGDRSFDCEDDPGVPFRLLICDFCNLLGAEMNHHLAQINISRLLAPLDDPQIAGFVSQLEPINALADSAPGFVWRLKSDSGNATDITYSDDPFVIVNMSVWESLPALRDFAYRSDHV